MSRDSTPPTSTAASIMNPNIGYEIWTNLLGARLGGWRLARMGCATIGDSMNAGVATGAAGRM